MTARDRLAPGTLRAAISERSERARREGALVPIPTRAVVVPDAGIAFGVHVVAGIPGKLAATRAQRAAGANPFLPYDPALWVADVGDAHVCLLNKFSVVDGHVLLVTRGFEEQESPLAVADFAALWSCLADTRGLGFYNSGEAAGASQRHRHLQVVPLPLGPGPAFPLAERVAASAPASGVAAPAGLPYPAALASVAALDARDADAPAELERLYREMLRRMEVVPGRVPYNLLATREWLWLVPRTRPEWQGIGVNALGFAGALLVPDDAALGRLRALGPLALLRAVAREGPRV